MARTWDTPSTHTTNTAFTTARSWSHTVGGGSNRYIWCGIATEDFSTGGGAQTPSSVAYGGNALTLDSIATVSSIQTAALYSGQDSVCGTAGAHNMVVTYSGEVNAIVAWAVSTDNVAQQIKEATGSVVQSTSVSNGTSNITTLTAESLIIAVAGDDEGTAGSGGTVGHSWNVGTEFGDLSIASVGGSMVRYEKATAGAQAMTDTLSEGVSRLCMVSAAYETINSAAPTVTNISAQTGVFGTQKSVACTIADTDSDIVRCDVSTDGACLITLTASGSAVVTNNGTTAAYVTGTHADVVATLGNNIKLDRAESWPTRSASETITVLVTDDLDATGNDTFAMAWGIATGVGTRAIKLTGTYAQIIAALPTIEWTPSTDFTGTTQVSMYSLTSTPLDDTDTFTIAVTASVGGGAPSAKAELLSRRRRKRS